MAKPTILLIPGACTEATCFDRLRPLLHDAGYETVAVSHPSANPTDPFAHTAETMALNVEQNYVQPLLDAGKDILVYAYSSGGSQTGTNGPSWTKLDREARGVKGGVIGIVYMSCAPVPAGTTQLDFLGGALPPFVKTDTVRPLTHPSIPHPSKQANKRGTNNLPHTALPRPFRLRPSHPPPLQRRPSLRASGSRAHGAPARNGHPHDARTAAAVGGARARRPTGVAESDAGRDVSAGIGGTVYRGVRDGVGGCREGAGALWFRGACGCCCGGRFGGGGGMGSGAVSIVLRS